MVEKLSLFAFVLTKFRVVNVVVDNLSEVAGAVLGLGEED